MCVALPDYKLVISWSAVERSLYIQAYILYRIVCVDKHVNVSGKKHGRLAVLLAGCCQFVRDIISGVLGAVT